MITILTRTKPYSYSKTRLDLMIGYLGPWVIALKPEPEHQFYSGPCSGFSPKPEFIMSPNLEPYHIFLGWAHLVLTDYP